LDEFGTIAVDKRADLVLLYKNPLEDVRNIQKTLSSVMFHDTYFSKMQIRKMMSRLVNRKTIFTLD